MELAGGAMFLLRATLGRAPSHDVNAYLSPVRSRLMNPGCDLLTK